MRLMTYSILSHFTKDRYRLTLVSHLKVLLILIDVQMVSITDLASTLKFCSAHPRLISYIEQFAVRSSSQSVSLFCREALKYLNAGKSHQKVASESFSQA